MTRIGGFDGGGFINKVMLIVLLLLLIFGTKDLNLKNLNKLIGATEVD